MSPSPQPTDTDRQRRVRRTAGLLAGGAVAATSALALPALASQDPPADPNPAAHVEPTTTAPPTTAAPAPPTPLEELAAKWPGWSEEQRFLFRLWVSTPEEREMIHRWLNPPPPPPPPAPKPAARPAPKAAPKPAPKPAPKQAAGSGGQGHAGPGGYLACVRQRESGGRYSIDTGNGYHGAYQFLQSTWNSTARSAGRSDLVGVNPAHASPGDQDAMAQHLYAQQGRQPWRGNGC